MITSRSTQLILLICLSNVFHCSQGQTCSYQGECSTLIIRRYPCGWSTCQYSWLVYYSCQKSEACTSKVNNWSACTVTCGGGTRDRTVSCVGSQCSESTTESEACNTQSCSSAVDGNWGAWGAWMAGTCCCGGTETQTRTRVCDDPPPSNGGVTCPGSPTETRSVSCNTMICVISCVGVPTGTFFNDPCLACSSTYYRCEVGRPTATMQSCSAGLFWRQSLMTCDRQCDP